MKIGKHKSYESHGSGRFRPEDFKAIGDNAVIEEGVLVFHPETISIGTNVYVGHNTILKGYHKNEMSIGDHTWIGQNCFFHSAGGLRIGRAVGIGPMVKILTSAHRDDDLSKPVIFHELELAEVIVGDGADIGTGSILLPGVHIGDGAVVGAGSVVTKDVPEYYVVAGAPARVLRKRGK